MCCLAYPFFASHLPSPHPWLAVTYPKKSSKWPYQCLYRVFPIPRSMNSLGSVCAPSKGYEALFAKLEGTFRASDWPQVGHAFSPQWIERYVSLCLTTRSAHLHSTQFLCDSVKRRPDLALTELQTELREVCDIEASVQTIARTLQREGYTMKSVRRILPLLVQYSHPLNL